MIADFKRGYTIYKNSDNGVIIVAPHSGPALEVVTSRDEYSETLASLCWKKITGLLVVSNMPRKRLYGIDFNRDIPTLKVATEYYKDFLDEKYTNRIYEYRKKYAWVAKDEKDYDNRLNIYQNFWKDISNGKYIIIIHRAYSRIKAVPSIMDITVFDENHKLKNKVVEAIEKINKRYQLFLDKIREDYRQAISFETKRSVLETTRIFKAFELNKISDEYKDNLKKDLEKVRLYADKIALNQLNRNFNPYTYLSAVKNALENSPTPKVTFHNVFSGDLSHGPKRKLSPFNDKIVIQIESLSFLSFWHPHIGSEMIKDLFEMIKN